MHCFAINVLFDFDRLCAKRQRCQRSHCRCSQQLGPSGLKYSGALFNRHVEEQNTDVLIDIITMFTRCSCANCTFLYHIGFDTKLVIPEVIQRIWATASEPQAIRYIKTLWSIVKLDDQSQCTLVDGKGASARISDGFRDCLR